MTRIYFTLCVTAIIVAGLISAIVLPFLPARVPIHWNIQGQVDGYGSPLFATLFVPAIMAALLVLFSVLPWLSPKQFETDTFRDTYGFIALVIMAFVGYTHGLTLWSAMGHRIDVLRALLAGMLLMFALMGNVMGKVRRNFWVGVRTPWTLANDRVWNDTHRLAGRLFVGAALVCVPLLFLPVRVEVLLIVVVLAILHAAIIPAAYSAVHYKSLQARGQL
jgi:immunity protein, SdpI family